MKTFFNKLGFAVISAIITSLFILAVAMSAGALYYVGSTIANSI